MTDDLAVQIAKIIADCCEQVRDAALEEAADIIEDSRGEIEENDDGRSAAVDEHCLFLIDRIRALRGPHDPR